MRPIKFRALVFEREFVYGYYVTDNKEYHAIMYPNPDDENEMINRHVNGATVGEFTGLTDKNGIDIYEGDIIKNSYDFEDEDEDEDEVEDFNIYKVVFGVHGHSNTVGFHCIEPDNITPYDYYGGMPDKEYSLVIGNEHQSPELMESK